MNKHELIEIMNDELFESEINDKEFFILSLIKNHFEENYKDEDNKVIKGLAEYAYPLQKAYKIFTRNIDIQKVLEKIYTDYFVEEQTQNQITIFTNDIEDIDNEEDYPIDDEDC